jgi:glycosyltransferase involved in cell wall biosynthesis
MPLSIALPFYNTSEFFLDAIKIPLINDNVTEILVSDDCSTKEEYEKLNSLIEKVNSTKIKVVRNEKNVGAFKNKYNAVQYCSNEWVYILDSDNYVLEGMLEKFFKEDLNKNVCYVPHKYYFCNSIQEMKFGLNIMNRENIITAIKAGICGNFINLGNFFVNKESFLKKMKDGLDVNNCAGADCMLMIYNWLKNDGLFKVIPDFYYVHRARVGNYIANQQEADACIKYYENELINLAAY